LIESAAGEQQICDELARRRAGLRLDLEARAPGDAGTDRFDGARCTDRRPRLNPLRAADGRPTYGAAARPTFAAYRPRAANVVGLTDQTNLFFTIADALRLPQTDEELSRNGRIQLAPRTVTASSGVVINGSAFYGDETVTVTLRRGHPRCRSRPRPWLTGRPPSRPPPPIGRGTWTVRAVRDQSGRTVTQQLSVR